MARYYHDVNVRLLQRANHRIQAHRIAISELARYKSRIVNEILSDPRVSVVGLARELGISRQEVYRIKRGPQGPT